MSNANGLDAGTSKRSKKVAVVPPVPPAEPPQEPFDLRTSPERFLNREISWLAFNGRVLQEAQNKRHPVLERVRFLSISSSNLSEFFMVRVAGLWGMVKEGVSTISDDGLNPMQQLSKITEGANRVLAEQQRVWISLRKELGENGIAVVAVKSLKGADRAWLDTYFQEQIFPVLTPLAIDPAHPFPSFPISALPWR